MAYENLKAAIKQAIKQNGNQEITGNLLQSTLFNMVNTLGAEYKFLGFANSSTVPPTSEEGRLLYFTTGHGDSYTNFPTSASGTYITLGHGIYALTREANSEYWRSDVVIEIAQELGDSIDKVISQKTNTVLLNSAIITGASYLFKSESDTGVIDMPLNNLKIGNSILVEDPAPSNVQIYLMYDNKQKFIEVKANEITKITRDDIEFLRLYVNANQKVSAKITVFNNIIKTLCDDVANIKTDTEQNKTDILNIKDNEKTNAVLLNSAIITGASYLFKSQKIGALDIELNNLKIGNSILVEDIGPNTSVFLFYGEQSLGEYIYIKANEITKITRDDFKFIRIYNSINNPSAKITVFNNIIKTLYDDVANINDATLLNTDFRILILGDSYSDEVGANWIKPMMSKFSKNSSYISLAVSSASIRDKKQDRNTYPYTSRPVSSVNEGNLNTLSCQIEKLERLMLGSDLSEGETKIYSTEDEYPNVIIIEGGMNDTFDSDDKELTYFNQFEIKKDNVYAKRTKTSDTTLRSVYVKPSLDSIDRTCFAGAYRYIVEKLLQKFPKAQIFFTTCSNLGYYGASVIETRYKVRMQQRKCADLCSATIIDWGRDGQINNSFNCPTGSGTEQDPYIIAENDNAEAYKDSYDLMHPNKRGQIKYGYLAARIIKNHFLSLYNSI